MCQRDSFGWWRRRQHALRFLYAAAIDGDGSTVTKGDILIGGEPIDFEKQAKDTPPSPPPVVVYKNGKDTRVAATATNGSPGLL